MDEEKQDLVETPSPKKRGRQPGSQSKKVDLEAKFTLFQEQVTKTLEILTAKLERTPKEVEADAILQANIDEAGADEEEVVSPAWKKLVKTILGPDFSCERREDRDGNMLFKIIVPKEKSNAGQLHWDIHKRDVRTMPPSSGRGIEAGKEWCLRVRANLIKSGMDLVKYP